MINWQDRLNPQAGGAETHLHEVFGRLVRWGHRVTLLVSGWRGAPRQAVVDGMEVHRAGGRHTFALAAAAYYRTRLRSPDFDLVIEDLNKVPLFTPLWVSRPLVLLVHHLFGRTAFEEAALPLAAATWMLEQPLGRVYRGVPTQAVSGSTALDLQGRGFAAAQITVIPNGIDLESYSPAGDGRFPQPTLLYLGRLKRYKRIDLVLQAVRTLRERGVAARLIIAGRGDYASQIERLRDELRLHDRVQILGYVSEEEKRELLRRAWVHVLTSSKEGWGITNLEAAACGTPTVASDSPGLRDSVVDGATGFLVPHGRTDALADRLELLLIDQALRSRMGQQARTFAEHFSWERAARDTLAHLEQVLRPAA
ncbi:MAG: glycosyltransferase family 4 protein [Gemmatimonadetes bacterium]|nr:glycosyltransferase family 4 protein [Gemmatimonadota bacterium]